MKKLFAVIAVVILTSFTDQNDKKLKVELTLTEWQAVIGVIEQSNAPHLQVKGVQELLIPQLNKQIDTTKSK